MIEILQNKNSATRFQILVEIAASGPNIHQRTIAAKLGITPQAVSDYIRQMAAEEMLVSTGRSSHRVSIKGVNWVLKMLRELNEYIPLVTKAVTNLTVCAAIAEADIRKGQPVGLKMKDGLLFATTPDGGGARGIAMSTSKRGEDVDVAEIEGLVDLTRGTLEIFQVPSIAKGGSKKTNTKFLKARILGRGLVGAIGIEALVGLRKINIEPQYLYGVTEAAVEAVHCGISFIIVCSDDAIPDLIKKLREERLEFVVTDLTLKPR
jgi:putative transcriptional regulator